MNFNTVTTFFSSRSRQAKSSKRPWTNDEDQLLLRLISEHGECWPRISAEMESRTGKQCRERFLNQLNPNIKKGCWTHEEDEMIKSLHEQLGNRWCKYVPYLPGRSDNSIKNRWHIICRPDSEQRSSPSSTSMNSTPPSSFQQGGPVYSLHNEMFTNSISPPSYGNCAAKPPLFVDIADSYSDNDLDEFLEVYELLDKSPVPENTPATSFDFDKVVREPTPMGNQGFDFKPDCAPASLDVSGEVGEDLLPSLWSLFSADELLLDSIPKDFYGSPEKKSGSSVGGGAIRPFSGTFTAVGNGVSSFGNGSRLQRSPVAHTHFSPGGCAINKRSRGGFSSTHFNW